MGNDAIQNVDAYGHQGLQGAFIGGVIGGATAVGEAWLAGGDAETIYASAAAGALAGALMGFDPDLPLSFVVSLENGLQQLFVEILHHRCRVWTGAEIWGAVWRTVLAAIYGALLGWAGDTAINANPGLWEARAISWLVGFDGSITVNLMDHLMPPSVCPGFSPVRPWYHW